MNNVAERKPWESKVEDGVGAQSSSCRRRKLASYRTTTPRRPCRCSAEKRRKVTRRVYFLRIRKPRSLGEDSFTLVLLHPLATALPDWWARRFPRKPAAARASEEGSRNPEVTSSLRAGRARVRRWRRARVGGARVAPRNPWRPSPATHGPKARPRSTCPGGDRRCAKERSWSWTRRPTCCTTERRLVGPGTPGHLGPEEEGDWNPES